MRWMIAIGCSVIVALILPFVSAQDKFVDSLENSVKSIRPQLERNDEYGLIAWSARLEGTKKFVYDIVDKFVFPLLLIVSVLTVILWLYEIMFSSEDDLDKWIKYIGYGVGGIVIIQSAKFITATYIGILGKVAPIKAWQPTLTFSQSALEIYKELLMPFISIVMYVVLGGLFVLLMFQVIKMITTSEEDVTGKAKAIIISNIVGIMVILLAKTIVEAIYGKQAEVLAKPTTIGDIGSGILADADLTIVFSIVNYVLWFVALIILILIIIQTYQLLVNPTNEELIKKTKMNILYILLWLAMIALAYVIVNFIIIK